ncbi:MAG TPA: hypothetical protein VGJ20_16625 [Xanthobacteraceae bacterium]|jgi:hypothetical protein
MPTLKVIAAPDPELLVIGRELDKIEDAWHRQIEAEERRYAAKEAACRAVGLHEMPPPDPGDKQAWRAWEANERRRCMVPYEGKDEDDADINDAGESIAWNAINERLFELLDQALAIRATTVAGLAVQLRAFDLAMGDMIREPHVEKLVGAVYAFAGVNPARQAR